MAYRLYHPARDFVLTCWTAVVLGVLVGTSIPVPRAASWPPKGLPPSAVHR